jgi:N,N-dimethylformamidase beta subunit-like, C-terminal
VASALRFSPVQLLVLKGASVSLPFSELRLLPFRVVALLLAAALAVGGVVVAAAPARAAGPCDAPVASIIACENSKAGTPQTDWEISNDNDQIEGFTTDISANKGETVRFKIKTTAHAYTIEIFRVGYYQGNGARRIATISPSVSLPQSQPACYNNTSTGLVDCGNWAVSASWTVPSDAVSGVYFALLTRSDSGASNHIPFVVRDDASHSDLVFQTDDTTWQAYNRWGGSSVYTSDSLAAGRAYKVSYNRPFSTRNCCSEDFLFSMEYPMIRFLERNGYDLSYTSGIDSDRRGASSGTTRPSSASGTTSTGRPPSGPTSRPPATPA